MAERPQQGTTSDAYIVAGTGDAWSADAAGQGRVGTQRLLRVATVDPPDSVRSALDLSPGEQVVVRSRLMLLDDRPVEIATSYYPKRIAAGTPLVEPAKIRGGAVAVLSASGHAPAEAFEQVTARRPNAEEIDTLQVDVDEPILVLMRTNVGADGRPVEHAVNRMVARFSAPIAYRMRIPQG